MNFSPDYCPFSSDEGTANFVSDILSSGSIAQPQPPLTHHEFILTPVSFNDDQQNPATPLRMPPKASITAVKPSGTARRTVPFSAKELFEVVQAALNVRIFEAKFGERGDTEKAMGDKIQEHGVLGSNGLFKTRMLEMLVWHEVRVSDLSRRARVLNLWCRTRRRPRNTSEMPLMAPLMRGVSGPLSIY